MMQDLMSVYSQNESSFTGLEIPPAQPSTPVMTPAPARLLNDEIDQMFPMSPIRKLILASETCPEKALDGAKDVYYLSYIQKGKAKAEYIHALAVWVRAVINATKDAEKVGGAQTYCAFEPALRFIIHIAGEDNQILARESLNNLFLAQTTSSPETWWVDAYTKEIDPESDGELDTNVIAQDLLTNNIKLDEVVEQIKKAAITKRNLIAQRDGHRPAACLPTSETSLAGRLSEVYGDQKFHGVLLSTLALRAASTTLSDDDTQTENNDWDDRGFVPPTLLKSYDPDGDLMSKIPWTTLNKWRAVKSHAWKFAVAMFPYRKDVSTTTETRWEWYTAEENMIAAGERRSCFLRQLAVECGYSEGTDFRKFAPRKNLIAAINELAKADELQAAATLFFQTATDDAEEEVTIGAIKELIYQANALQEQLAETKDYKLRKELKAQARSIEWQARTLTKAYNRNTMSVVDITDDEVDGDVVDTLELFMEEISEREQGMGRSHDPEIESIDAYTMAYFKKLANTMPHLSANPTATAAWQVAYTSAIAASSTQDQAQGTAWAAFRQEVSPAGANAYEAEMAVSGDRNKAMTTFRKIATNLPKKQAEIVTIKGDGTGVVIAEASDIPAFKPLAQLKVRLEDGTVVEIADPVGFEQPVQPAKITRDITWYVADKKLLAGELDLTKKDKMVAVLNQKQFPHARYFLDHVSHK